MECDSSHLEKSIGDRAVLVWKMVCDAGSDTEAGGLLHGDPSTCQALLKYQLGLQNDGECGAEDIRCGLDKAPGLMTCNAGKH